jgi:type II secretory pathway component PulK
MASESGVALLIVLWLMAVLTLLMYAFLSEMQVEYAVAGGFAEEKQAEQLAWSAIDRASAWVAADPQPWQGLGDAWSHDDLRFFEVPLGGGAFTLLHPTYDAGPALWGIEDEASKINVNYAPADVLARLPRVTREIAEAIVDWRDADDNPGPAGAEAAYYATLTPPYRCKNQPFETIEELLLVRDVTPEILYGEDWNLNGRLDPNENDGDDSFPPDNADGQLDPGLYAFVTVVSRDRNVDAEGQPRVNVNTAAPAQLQEVGFTAAEIQAISVQRLAGPLPSVAHLLGSEEEGVPRILTPDRFRQLVDFLTVAEGEVVPGLVNVNTAPLRVLRSLPGTSEETALQILGYRTPEGADLSNIGWLLDILEPAQLQAISNFITVRSYQFRIHAVGRVGTPYTSTSRAEDGRERPGAFKRMVAVFDKIATPRPRVIYWKDLTRLGMGYDPEDGPTPTP